MPEKLKQRLQTQKYFLTTNEDIVDYLSKEGVKPYNSKPDKYNPNAIAYFYGNSSMLRACLYHYYDRND